MDIMEQVTNWVEKKLGNIINKDLKEKIFEENSEFDVEVYVNNLLDKYINEDDLKSLKEILSSESHYDLLYFECDNSTEEQSTQESLESEPNEFHSFSINDLVDGLESEFPEVKKKSLKILEGCAEDLISETSWNKVKDALQKILNKEDDREIIKMTLKVFHKPLICSKKPEIVTKGFITISEIITNQIDLYNSKFNSFQEIYETEEKWRNDKSPRFRTPEKQKTALIAETLIKLMWLLIDCQQQIPVKWVRFREAGFREIIFSFINLLSSTNTSEGKKLSALKLVSILNPKADWCSYWCHTAVGRILLCSALRKYKNFFIQVIEIILYHIKTKKSSRLPLIKDSSDFNKNSPTFSNEFLDNVLETKYPKQTERNKFVNSAPENANNDLSKSVRLKKPKISNPEWLIESIPTEVLNEAVFFHSICFVSCLIQFRSGRALFPVQTTMRKRLLSVQDFSLTIIEYLENIDYQDWSSNRVTYTPASQAKVLEMLDILKRVKAHISSSRMSTDRQQFPYL